MTLQLRVVTYISLRFNRVFLRARQTAIFPVPPLARLFMYQFPAVLSQIAICVFCVCLLPLRFHYDVPSTRIPNMYTYIFWL